MNTLPRPLSNDPSSPTVAGRLRLRLENDGEWWKLFDPVSSREEFEKKMTGWGIFKSPWLHRDFIENNSLKTIVHELWWNCKGHSVPVPDWISLGFARLMDVLAGRDHARRPLTLVTALTPLCAMSPEKLKITLGEQIDMGVLCGHDDETRMAWAWFKSLLCTLTAIFRPGIRPPDASSLGNRDSLEMNEIFDLISTSKKRIKWKFQEEREIADGDWLTASFQGHYRPNTTICWWCSEDGERIQETSLDESIAARITGQCHDDGVKGLWLKGYPDMVLSAEELREFRISMDPWERIDKTDIPWTSGTSNSFQIAESFDPSSLPRLMVHEITDIPFETVRGFPCVHKQRHLIL